MKHHPLRPFIIILCLIITVQSAYSQATPIELQNGDQVVFVGDGLFENELDYGYLEYVLTTAWPDRHITFRNIGWSGDTPAGTSRDHFTNPPTAYDHLIEQIKATQPTVAFVGYGAHLAFEEKAKVNLFIDDLHALLDTLESMGAQVVLVSPAPQEPETSPAPAVQAFNEQLALVSKQIEQTALNRSYTFVNFYDGLIGQANDPNIHISDNGFQLNAYGYYLAGKILAKHIRTATQIDDLTIDLKKGTQSSQIAGLQASRNEIAFSIDAGALPIPPPMQNRFETTTQTLHVTGLRRGNYGVWIGSQKVTSASSKDLARGLSITTPHAKQAQELQQLIYKKNQTYFYQYRPQNETYLVGFREYEQGNNARELQLLDPLIGEIENEIGRLRIPRDVSVKIVAE